MTKKEGERRMGKERKTGGGEPGKRGRDRARRTGTKIAEEQMWSREMKKGRKGVKEKRG